MMAKKCSWNCYEIHENMLISIHLVMSLWYVFFLLHSGDKRYRGGCAAIAHTPWLLSLVFTALVASIMFSNNPFATIVTHSFMHWFRQIAIYLHTQLNYQLHKKKYHVFFLLCEWFYNIIFRFLLMLFVVEYIF